MSTINNFGDQVKQNGSLAAGNAIATHFHFGSLIKARLAGLQHLVPLLVEELLSSKLFYQKKYLHKIIQNVFKSNFLVSKIVFDF